MRGLSQPLPAPVVGVEWNRRGTQSESEGCKEEGG